MSEGGKVRIFTDGSSRGNPGPGGYGALLISGSNEKKISGGFRKTTNNRMELMAAIKALQSLKFPCEVSLSSDSRYVINAFEKGWIYGWKKNGWAKAKGAELLNADLWQALYAAQQPHQMEWKWVKGHAGIRENEICDDLATRAAALRELPVDEGFASKGSINKDLFG